MHQGNITILVVGICASGKSSVIKELQQLGFKAKTCAQEHSCVESMWTKLESDVLIFLDCSYETVKKRRDVPWGLKRIQSQKEKLQDALDNCDLYLKTDNLTLQETVERIVEYLKEEDFIQKVK